MIEIIAGDDSDYAAQLYKDAATFTIDAGATVEARLISIDRQTTYTDVLTCSNGASGADWANSLVVVEIAEADTLAITYSGMALLEIQVDDSGKITFFGSVVIALGTIP
jgi:hypothetical protein